MTNKKGVRRGGEKIIEEKEKKIKINKNRNEMIYRGADFRKS